MTTCSHPTLFDLPHPTARPLAERPLREWPIGERPVERVSMCGAAALSDAELLAVLFTGSGTNPVALAQQLIVRFGGWRGLQQATLEDLQQVAGLGRTRAAQVKATLEIARRLLLTEHEQRFQVKSPADAASLLMLEMSHLDQEHLRTVLLDTKNRVQTINTVYIGSLNASMIRVGEIFKEALKRNSAALIIVHNHPSGAPRSA